jgi:hypothetical protein
MLEVALGQSWGPERDAALFEQAVAFEPAYESYYRNYVVHLLPRWSGGADGDPARFAAAAADRRAGDAGDILYFQIADKMVCACEDPEFTHLSWPRIERGFAALEKEYGASLVTTNSFTLMAVMERDWVTADEGFKRIGDNWDNDVWRTENWFKQNRDTAAKTAPLDARSHAIKQEARDNMKTPEGATYQKAFKQEFAAIEKSCVEKAESDRSTFELLIQVGKDGGAQDVKLTRGTELAHCLVQAVYVSRTKKETPFPPPPHAPYWVIVEVDPDTLIASVR